MGQRRGIGGNVGEEDDIYKQFLDLHCTRMSEQCHSAAAATPTEVSGTQPLPSADTPFFAVVGNNRNHPLTLVGGNHKRLATLIGESTGNLSVWSGQKLFRGRIQTHFCLRPTTKVSISEKIWREQLKLTK